MNGIYKSIVTKYCDGVGYLVTEHPLLRRNKVTIKGKYHGYRQSFEDWMDCYSCLCDQIELTYEDVGEEGLKRWLGDDEWNFICKDWHLNEEELF